MRFVLTGGVLFQFGFLWFRLRGCRGFYWDFWHSSRRLRLSRKAKNKNESTLLLLNTPRCVVPLTSGGSCAFIGSWLSISISPLCVILVMGRLSASLCSFSIISIVCEMRNVCILASKFSRHNTTTWITEAYVYSLHLERNKIIDSRVGSPFCAKRPVPLRPVPQGSFESGSQVIFHLWELSCTGPEQLTVYMQPYPLHHHNKKVHI